jgi:hypothetical protein
MHGNEPVTPSPNPASAGWPPPAPPTPDGGRNRRIGRVPIIAGAVVASFFVVGLGVAYAQSDSSGTTATTLPAVVPPPAGQIAPAPAPTPAPPGPNAPPGGRFGRGHHGGPFGKLFGMGGFGHFGRGGPLHGEFTIRKPDGSGFQTMAVQTGEVTAVSPSSITVKSEDGFSRTYSVDENTVVGSGSDGIGTVKTGDTVRVAGVVDGGQAKAAAILDSTSLGKIGEHWGIPKRK